MKGGFYEKRGDEKGGLMRGGFFEKRADIKMRGWIYKLERRI
jgi:hypothetical protein